MNGVARGSNVHPDTGMPSNARCDYRRGSTLLKGDTVGRGFRSEWCI